MPAHQIFPHFYIFEATFNTSILTDELSKFRVWTSQNRETLEQELAL